MTKKEKRPKVTTGPLTVYNNLWKGKRWYVNRKGHKVPITFYFEAREYASNNGYLGIRIKHV